MEYGVKLQAITGYILIEWDGMGVRGGTGVGGGGDVLKVGFAWIHSLFIWRSEVVRCHSNLNRLVEIDVLLVLEG